MSRYFEFFVEYDSDGKWSCLPELINRDVKIGPFAESLFNIPYRSPLVGLFFSDDSLIKFHEGIPSSPISQEVLLRVSGSVWWINYYELMFDDWHNSFVIVSSQVEHRYVSCFRGGDMEFPENVLRKKGMVEEDLVALRDYMSAISLVDLPLDREYEYIKKTGNKLFDVTWKKSINDFVGPQIVRKIKLVRDRYGSEKLRFIVSWG
jgi:hypothetical protein